jgi:hypothetical protein
MKININQHAKVVLTSRGAEIWNKYLNSFTYSGARKGDFEEGDELKTALWELFQVFGEYIYMGMTVPFKDCELEIEEWK